MEGVLDEEENNLQSIVGTRRKEENIPEKTSSRQTRRSQSNKFAKFILKLFTLSALRLLENILHNKQTNKFLQAWTS